MKTRHLFVAALAAFALSGCVMYQTYDGDGGSYYYAEQAPAYDYYDDGYGCDYAFCTNGGYPFGYGSFGYSPYGYSSFGYFGGYGYPYNYNCYSYFGGCTYPYGYGGLIYLGGGYPFGFGGAGYFGYPSYSRPYVRPSIQPRPPQHPDWNDRNNHSPRPGQWSHDRPPYPQGEPRPGLRPAQRPISQPVPSPRTEDGPYNRPNVRPGAMLQPALPRQQPADMADGERNRPLPLQREPRPESRPNAPPFQRQAPQLAPPAPQHTEDGFRSRSNDASGSQRQMSLPPPRSSHPPPAASHDENRRPARKDDNDH
jgi:hypothetical protein